MSENPLDEYLSSLQRKEAELETFMDTFSKLAVHESDEFKRIMDKMIARYAEILKDLFVNIELLAKAQVGINNKLDALTEIVLEVSEVKSNPAIQNVLDEIFKAYQSPPGQVK